MFTGDEFADGGEHILNILRQQNIKASFFLTGNFYRNPKFRLLIKDLKKDGHYLGPHSDKHLLYCDWQKRDSLLVTASEFKQDLKANYRAMSKFGINEFQSPFFLPPFEWYNDTIASWSEREAKILVNYSPGTISHTDYTTPEMKNYRSSDDIYNSIITYANNRGMNGFILLMHIGTDPKRSDKFYLKLNDLINHLRYKYELVRIDELLSAKN